MLDANFSQKMESSGSQELDFASAFGCLQWARIVLVVERGVSPAERLKKLMDYSQPMSDGRRALVLRLNQSVRSKTFITILAVIVSIQCCQKYCVVKQSPVTVFPHISFLVAGILRSFWFPLRPTPVKISLQNSSALLYDLWVTS